MLGSELDEFLAHLDDISTDSTSIDHYQLQKQKSENKKLKSLLVSMKDSTKDILNLYKNERQITINLQQKLDHSIQEFNDLQRKFDEFDRTNVNKVFSLNELINDMTEKQTEEHENYLELAQDYFFILSDVTCFYNYEIKKAHNKVISKTEKFLYNSLGETYKKPKITRSKRMQEDDDKSIVSRTSTRASKRVGKTTETKSKRVKTEIWDMKSISQASSPAATIPFQDEDISNLSSDIYGAESSFSFNTFSIGNETSFSFLQSQKSSPNSKCKCHLLDKEVVLVSVGTNTEEVEGIQPSVPCILSDEEPLHLLEYENEPEAEIEAAGSCKETRVKILESCTEAKIDNEESLSTQTAAVAVEPILVAVPKYSTASTNTETELTLVSKLTSDQGTSPEPTSTCNKATATVHSTTTRGTSTAIAVTKSFGVQFPEISLEKIFSETIFEMPDCISPIHDIVLSTDDEEEEMVKTASFGTITELCNVNREIDYTTSKFKSAVESSLTSNDDSFIILGQTLFDLFLKRIRRSNKLLSDDEFTRKKIWKLLKRQLLDRFSELSFDENFNASLSDSEMPEKIPGDKEVEETNNNEEESCREKFDASQEVCLEDFDKNSESFESPKEEKKVLENQKTINMVENDEKIQEGSMEIEENLALELQESVKILENSDETSEKIERCVTKTSPELLESLDTVAESAVCQESVAEVQKSLELPNEIFKVPMTTSASRTSSPPETVIDYEEFEGILNSMKEICSTPPHLLDPIGNLDDVIWGSLFPEVEVDDFEDSPASSLDVLEGFDVDFDAIEIPTEQPEVFTEFDTPKSPLPFMMGSEEFSPVEIPEESMIASKNYAGSSNSILEYSPQTRVRLVQWQQRKTITNKLSEKRLCKARKAIKTYLEDDWTDENLEKCVASIDPMDEKISIEAIAETVEDNKWQKDVNTEFTPPAPPLPRYQQKLILLVKRLADKNPKLPHLLIDDLEEKLFRLENSSMELDDLRNVSYYYTALVDLFFNGDTTMTFYFIVKNLYIFGFKAIPMIFVVIKAFPMTLPKKSLLLKKYSPQIDWENMSGQEISKVQFDFEKMDSLDLTVMYLLTCIQVYRKNAKEIKNHELFNYLPKFYGFQLSFLAAPRLLNILMKRLDIGELENLSISFILLAKRSHVDFTIKTLLKDNLIPHLDKLMARQENFKEVERNQVCLLIESISAIIKPFAEEKEKTFRVIFPTIVGILGRVQCQKIQESCIKAILRLQRFIDNHKEIFTIIKHHQETSGRFSDSLRYAIQTFIHRKNENQFKNST